MEVRSAYGRLRDAARADVGRSFVVALAATLLAWGPTLSSRLTLSPVSQTRSIHPLCRVATSTLTCQTRNGPSQSIDAGAPAWQEAPADYVFRNARARGQPRPSWNPYVGSGYPIALDGINAPTSPTRWFLSRVPGDQGRDVLVFVRFLLWTFPIVWAVALVGASTPLLVAAALAAVFAPYPASFVDIVFLDVDLLSPWFLLLLVALVERRLSLRAAAAASLALGLFVSSMGFVQAQIVFCAAVGLLALAAAPRTRGRSLVLAAGVAAGELAFSGSWLPLLLNLDEFVSSRTVVCVIEMGQGAEAFWRSLLDPPMRGLDGSGATATLVGGALVLAFGTRRWAFLVATLLAIGAWIVLGLPHAACALPLLSGARFVRHLVPHFQMLFIFAVAAAAHAAAEQVERKRAWLAFAAAAAASLVIAARAGAGLGLSLVVYVSICALLGIAAGVAWRRSPARGPLAHAALGIGLALFAFLPYLFASPNSKLRWTRRTRAPQVAALPSTLDPSTPLGAVQRLARTEDRRHFSPAGFLYPNWSAALDIPDLLVIGAFYPRGYHELNAALFPGWERDPQHGLVPDRFVPPPPAATMALDFQRILAVHRVSLLTFLPGQAFFAGPPSPYQRGRCKLVARSLSALAESWVCPEIGGIGYFPEVVRVARSRPEALALLRQASPEEILRLGVLGPELDAAGPAEAGAGRVLSFQRQGDDLAYQLEVDRAGVFVVADTWFRGWRATVNGAPTSISRANVAFKAVRVPKGHVELRLHFSPET